MFEEIEIDAIVPRTDGADACISELIQRIETRKYTIGIMGLGYVGLPLALTAVKSGFKVLGLSLIHI